MKFDDVNSDLCLHVIRFLNAKDGGRLSLASKRFFYLVHEYRRLRGPELATAASRDDSSQILASDVFRRAMDRLQQPPNFVLCFASEEDELSSDLGKLLVEPSIHVLGPVASDIQVNMPKADIEHESRFSVLVGSFPRAQIQPFKFDRSHNSASVREVIEGFKSKTIGDYPCPYNDRNQPTSTPVKWKAAIVLASGLGANIIETVISQMQAALPDLAIVGGICEACYFKTSVDREQVASMTVRQLRMVLQQRRVDASTFVEKSELIDAAYECLSSGPAVDDGGIHGVLLGGEIPIQSVVSRGVKSVFQGMPKPSSPFVVDQADMSRPGDLTYIFEVDDDNVDDMFPFHSIRSIRNQDTGKVYSATEIMRMSNMNHQPQFIGLRRPNEDGFRLNMISPLSFQLGRYIIMTEGFEGQDQTMVGADFDLFYLDGEAIVQDMESTVAALKEQTKGEQILGAVMFSCNGRGPLGNHIMPDDMTDAKRFAEAFPDVPCLGCYCGGEVGPLAMVGKTDVFQKGHAAVQGFTAVFAVFIVPVPNDRISSFLDDSDANVNKFVDNRLGHSD